MTMLFAFLLAAQAVTTATSPVAPVPAEKPEKKVCRADEPATGSMMPGKRICHTKAEWIAIDEANQRNTDNIRRRSEGSSPPRM